MSTHFSSSSFPFFFYQYVCIYILGPFSFLISCSFLGSVAAAPRFPSQHIPTSLVVSPSPAVFATTPETSLSQTESEIGVFISAAKTAKRRRVVEEDLIARTRPRILVDLPQSPPLSPVTDSEDSIGSF